MLLIPHTLFMYTPYIHNSLYQQRLFITMSADAVKLSLSECGCWILSLVTVSI